MCKCISFINIESNNFEPKIPTMTPIMPVLINKVICSIASILRMLPRVSPMSSNNANSRVRRLINRWFAYIKKMIIVMNKKTEPTFAP